MLVLELLASITNMSAVRAQAATELHIDVHVAMTGDRLGPVPLVG
jgi:hypothetical protein